MKNYKSVLHYSGNIIVFLRGMKNDSIDEHTLAGG